MTDSNSSFEDNSPQSPCTGICQLDANDLCYGCLRHSDEITIWSRASDTEKTAILKKVEQRLAASQQSNEQ